MYMRHLFTLLVAIPLLSISVKAQFSYAYIDSIEVVKDGNTLKDPWIGGFNSPQFSQIDLNHDGIKDLFVFDRKSNTIKTFLNQGTAGNTDYVYAPIYQQYFPDSLDGFTLLADYNNDGKEDIFSYRAGSMIVHKNVTTNNIPAFEPLFTNHLPAIVFNNPSNVYCNLDDLPGLFDVDDDGDLDVLSFHLGGLKIDFFENITPAGTDSLILERATDCWGQFYEHPQNDTIVLSSCKRSKNGSARHTGSTLTLLHLDNNDRLDLILGDVDSPHLNALMNTGTKALAHMTTVEYGFPASDVPADLRDFLGSFLIDVDNDGDQDLLVAPNDRQKGNDINNVWLYKNNGSDSDADLELIDTTFIASDMIDHGTAAHPTFVDIDGDNLLDIIVGHEGYFESYNNSTFVPEYITQLAFYRNIGTAAKPKYELITDDFANVSSLTLKGAYPTFGDLDNDGDQDILIGTNDGWLVHLDNTSGPSVNPTYQILDDKYFFLKSLAASTPQLFDIDGDTDLDLVVGEKDGYMKFYTNTGSASAADFSPSNVIDTLGDIHLFRPGYTSTICPQFASINSTTYMFVGTNFGDVIIYDNIDGNLNGTFNPIDTIRFSGGYISPSLANINDNDSLELMIGEATGGISIFGIGDYELIPDTTIVDTSDTTSVRNLGLLDQNINVFPNPTKDKVNIGFKNLDGKSLEIQIHDLTGRNVYTSEYLPSSKIAILEIETTHLNKGIYLITIQSGNDAAVKKIIKL